MSHAFSLAHLSALELTPPELVMAAAEAGYDYVGLRLVAVTPGGAAWDVRHDRRMLAMTRACMDDTGVGVLDVELARLEPETDIESFRACLEGGAELGARHVLTQADDPEFNRLVDRYARLCEMAAPLGLSCDVEFIPWLRTRSLSDAAALVGAAGQPNGGVMIDTLHFARAGCDPKEIEALPAPWLRYMQLCDAPLQGPPTLQGLLYAAREERLFPGEGELDLSSVLRRLPEDIPIAIEIPTETLSFTAPPEERARLAREASLRLLARIER
jgi:sugar phosphate isomerase/epimerase